MVKPSVLPASGQGAVPITQSTSRLSAHRTRAVVLTTSYLRLLLGHLRRSRHTVAGPGPAGPHSCYPAGPDNLAVRECVWKSAAGPTSQPHRTGEHVDSHIHRALTRRAPPVSHGRDRVKRRRDALAQPSPMETTGDPIMRRLRTQLLYQILRGHGRTESRTRRPTMPTGQRHIPHRDTPQRDARESLS
jgi:hypothetical protein